MSVAQRRAAIVEATLPLLIEHGANVPTSKIAAAAGIAEGTVFRAFRDKTELLTACLHAVMESGHEVEQIAAIDRRLPLAQRLITALDHVNGYQNRLWSVAQAVHAAGVDMREARGGHDAGPPGSMVRVVNAIADMFDPERDELRVEPALAARLLLGLIFTNRMQGVGMGEVVADAEELVDFFLHGTQGRKKA
jgi:AcrR family transcriptional regulator